MASSVYPLAEEKRRYKKTQTKNVKKQRILERARMSGGSDEEEQSFSNAICELVDNNGASDSYTDSDIN